MEVQRRRTDSDVPRLEGGLVALGAEHVTGEKSEDLFALWQWYRHASVTEVQGAIRSLTEGVTMPTSPAEVDTVVSRLAWLATAYQFDALVRVEDPELTVKLPAWDVTSNLRLAWLAFRSIDSPDLANPTTRANWLQSLDAAAHTLVDASGDTEWEQRPLNRLLLAIRTRALELLPDDLNGTGTITDPLTVGAIVEEVTDLMDQSIVDDALTALVTTGCVDRPALVASFRAQWAEISERRRTDNPHIALYARYIKFRHYLHGPHDARMSVNAIEPELSEDHAEYFHGLLDGEYTQF